MVAIHQMAITKALLALPITRVGSLRVLGPVFCLGAGAMASTARATTAAGGPLPPTLPPTHGAYIYVAPTSTRQTATTSTSAAPSVASSLSQPLLASCPCSVVAVVST